MSDANFLAPLKGELARACERLRGPHPPDDTFIHALSRKPIHVKNIKSAALRRQRRPIKKIVAARRHLKLITHHSSLITHHSSLSQQIVAARRHLVLRSQFSHLISYHTQKKESAPSREIRQSAEGCTFPTEPLSPFWPCGRAAKIFGIMIVFGFEDFFVSEINLRDGGNRA